MAFNVKVDVNKNNQLQVVSQRIETLKKKIGDLDDVAEKIKKVIQEAAKDQIDTQGGRSGGYAPLSEDYAAYKARHSTSDKILIFGGPDSEDLYGSVTGEKPEGITVKITSKKIQYIINVPYAAVHQTGTINSALIPARPIIVLTDDDANKISQIVADAIANKVKG